MIAAYFAGRLNVVYTEHGRFYPDRKSWKRALVNPILARGVNHLVSISSATAQAMSIYDKLPRKRIKVIHNGIDCTSMNPIFDREAKRRELGIDDRCRIIGTAARLNSIKNISMMISGLKLVLKQKPNTFLVIAGTGEEEARLKMMAEEIGISSRVKFIGLRFDLAEIYPLFEIFLLTSFSEGISVTLLEAMASGVPAVVTDVGGNREVVVDGSTGYLVPVGQDDVLAQRIDLLLGDRSLSEKMGAASRQRVKEVFSMQDMMRSYQQLYESNNKS